MIVLRDPWRTRVLWLSVGLNLFGAALLGTQFATRPSHGPPGLVGAMERMARDLPPDDAARFRTALDRERPWYDMARHGMGESRAALARSIAQDPYDEAAVRERMHDYQARWAETSGRFGESLLVAIGTLSPQGRTKLAQHAQHSGPR